MCINFIGVRAAKHKCMCNKLGCTSINNLSFFIIGSSVFLHTEGVLMIEYDRVEYDRASTLYTTLGK